MSAKSAGRYAQSLLDYALELNKLEEVKQDMQLVSSVCAENHGLELLLASPIIKKDQKISVLTAVFEQSIQAVSMNFLTLVTKKNRERLIIQIAAAFIELYKAHKGIVTAEVTTATPLSEEQRKGIAASLESVGKTLELNEMVDPNILGGLMVRVGDRRFDASIRKKLNELKQDISK
jgi:F-type H+-transporting ATPase subunit delta